MSFFDELKGWVSEAKDLVSDVTGIFGDIKNVGKTSSTKAEPAQVPAYNPNITAGDFAFQPYYPLLIIGGILLVIVVAIKKG